MLSTTIIYRKFKLITSLILLLHIPHLILTESMSFGQLNNILLGDDSFDWNVQPDKIHHVDPMLPGVGNGSGGGGRRSPSPLLGRGYDPISVNGPSGAGGRAPTTRHHHQQQHHPDGYYNYPPPSSSSGNNGYHGYHHDTHHPSPTHQYGGHSQRGRSPSPSHHHHNNNGHHYTNGHYNQQHQHHHPQGHHHQYRGGRHSRSSSPVGNGEHLPRRNSHQALFPEHQMHSPGNPNGGGGRASRSRSTSPLKKRSSSNSSKNKKGSGNNNNNKAAHRSSVFRGSPTPSAKDNLPQELLLALEEDDSNSSSGGTTPPSSPVITSKKKGGGKKKKSMAKKKTSGKGAKKDTATNNESEQPPSNMDMIAIDPNQIDAVMLNEDVDDYLTNLNDGVNFSFRKSYDLEQVFSFIKEPIGNAPPGMSFNLGFSESKSIDYDDEKHTTGGGGGANLMGLTPINSFSENNVTAGAAGAGEGVMMNINSPKVIPSRVGGRDEPPVIHATPPSYSSQGYDHHSSHHSHRQYHETPRGGMISHSYTANTPPSQYHPTHPSSTGSYHSRNYPRQGSDVGAPSSFPNKRIKMSSRHTLYPLAKDMNQRRAKSKEGSESESESDEKGSSSDSFFGLLRKMAPAFVGFRFKLPEMVKEGGKGGTDNVVVVGTEDHTMTMMLDENQLLIAKRRINSSICAFGGSLPPRTVSPTPSIYSSSEHNHHYHHPPQLKEETSQERDERYSYEDALPSRYFMKERCISWDVEQHEVIPAKAGKTGRGKKGAVSTPRVSKKKQIGVFKGSPTTTTGKGGDATDGGKYCAPVTPSSPPSLGADASASHSTDAGATGDSEPGTPSLGKGAKGLKTKYRCKRCGLPKQNHKCAYKESVVRSIGTMVYPAVNAFVSNEPGRLAPSLSEMNNFASLLSHDTAMTGMTGYSSSTLHGGGMSFGGMMNRSQSQRQHHHHHRGPYGNVLTPDTSHWSPTTPGGLSTMSSSDPNTPPSNHNSPHRGNTGRKRDHRHLMMSRTMSMGLSSTTGGAAPPPVPHVPSMPPAPAGAISSDVLFRDTMEIKLEQYRTVGAKRVSLSSSLSSPSSNVADKIGTPTSPNSYSNTSSNAADVASTTPGGDSDNITTQPKTESVTAYRYPHIPTPYTQRKEMGDKLFELSREVPNLADSCAAILREARENDAWDQAVAELTTQVLVVLKCEESDHTLEGLRRHLLGLGIAC